VTPLPPVASLMGTFDLVLLLSCLFLLSGFLAGSEGAIFSLGQTRLKRLEDLGYRSAKYISHLLNDPEKLLITIIFANLFVNTLISSITTIVSIDISKSFSFPEQWGVTIGTIITTYFLILIGEVTPINLAVNFSEPYSRFASYPIYFLTFVFSRILPLIPVIKSITKIIMPFFGVIGQPATTEEELKSAISIGEREGMIEPHEKFMIHSIFEFGNTITKEIMTPRPDMACIKSDCMIEGAFKAFKEYGYSRIPVYENSLDNIIGIVHAKDLTAFLKEKKSQTAPIKTILRQAYFVPETQNIDSLLKELQQHKVQMAIVVDEYGGTEGLVTMEDVVEEIVGEIMDEHDEEEKLYEKLDAMTYKVDAKIPVVDFNKLMESEIPEELFDTLGGLLYDILGHVPFTGEEAGFEDLHFKIIQVEGKRIKKVIARKKPKPISDGVADADGASSDIFKG